MKKNKITIHDISKHIRVDSSATSRALNDSVRVSKKTKTLILNTTSEMGYQRNLLASNLRKRVTNTIGVVPGISRHFFFN
ncbi:LacI family DNA-binding transcriptional regulator [Flavivirga spongiicola]|uniref:LacI family DNA-binding transcriptional regulator n=1 Tax=Flavivirga spongiicola TaxID=421621 RepID=A0ABU7XNC0_9FLAO|nr:LacI family DNA-binding transcriptional regulator [Flavivirga sp. MEBiC05379]MDO5980166.1 LacI family DNA-binding transcriptional regulator [Flavivirga sp. MEBiC05379]MDO5981914.1 LacI family DNA-binding transcriptional regulator [Flavivirga sp. MEBiC05379]